MAKGKNNCGPHNNNSKRAPKAQYSQEHKFFNKKPQVIKPEVNNVSGVELSDALTGVLALNCIAQLRH